jgi:hypothetical protein
MQYRAFKKLVAWLLAITLPLLGLQGCGGGGGGPSAPSVPTQKAEGSVQPELAGPGLSVVSYFQDEAPVQSDGTFSTTVRQDSTQLLFLKDAQDQLRGLSLSIPSKNGTGTALVFNVETTALSLLYLTPGILSIDPIESESRIQELKNLPSFPDVVKYLDQNLPQKPLSDLLQGDELPNLLAQCIEEWLQTHTPKENKGIAPQPIQPVALFNVEVKNDSNPKAIALTLVNQDWRFVNVWRRDLDYNGNEVKAVSVADGLESMGGAIPYSWSILFKKTLNEPTKKDDIVDFSNPSLGRCEYWIRGPGASSPLTLPSSIKGTDVDAWGMSIVYYLAYPVLNLIGEITDTKDAFRNVAALWKGIKGGVNIAKVINAVGAKNLKDFFAGTFEIIVEVAKIVLKEGAKAVLKLFDIAMNSANCIIAFHEWIVSPRISKVDVLATGGSDVSIK